MKVGAEIEIEASAVADSGAGVAEVDGRSLHVLGLAPGERALVRVTAVSRHHRRAYGELLEPRSPDSPERQQPACPAYGRCGGCTWQHLGYPLQLREKQARLERALAAAGVEVRPRPIWPAPRELEYRNKGSYVLARRSGGGDGPSLVLGGRIPRSAEVADTRGCRVVVPAIDRSARAAGEVLERRCPLVIDDPSRPHGALRYLLARTGSEGELALGLVTRSGVDPQALQKLAADIAGASGADTVVHVVNDETSGALLSDIEPRPLIGRGTITERFGEAAVEVGIDSFVQVNRESIARVYRSVADWVQDQGIARVVDLYCGVGAFGLSVAAAGAQVLGIERSEDAERAARAATRAGLPARFVRADAAEVPPGSADAWIVNPPRKGLGAAVRDLVVTRRPPHLVYLSCGPESLARDLADLRRRGGYGIESIQPVDLMPGTAQVETLVQLHRD